MKKKRKKKIYQEPTTIMMTLNMMMAMIWVTESETPRNNGEKLLQNSLTIKESCFKKFICQPLRPSIFK